jgi:hypothetical protein
MVLVKNKAQGQPSRPAERKAAKGRGPRPANGNRCRSQGLPARPQGLPATPKGLAAPEKALKKRDPPFSAGLAQLQNCLPKASHQPSTRPCHPPFSRLSDVGIEGSKGSKSTQPLIGFGGGGGGRLIGPPRFCMSVGDTAAPLPPRTTKHRRSTARRRLLRKPTARPLSLTRSSALNPSLVMMIRRGEIGGGQWWLDAMGR